MRISYRQKIFISMTATLTFLIVTLILLAEIGIRDFSRRDLMNHAELVAKTFSESSLPFFIYYDWEELKRLSRNISYQDLISFIILDKENVVRISTKLEGWVGRKYNISPLPLPPDKTSMSEQYFLFSEKQKIRVVDVYVPVKVENSSESWGTIVLTFSLEKIKKGLARMRFVLIISGICLILSLSFLNRKIAEYIAKPVKILSEHVNEISKGNYDKKITPMGMDEFEELIISINLMAENLSKRERELREARDSLEEKVKERTEELRKSEEKFRDFFERAVEAILIIDIKDMKVEKANEMAEKLFRFPDGIEGKQISLLDNEKEELKALLEETIKNGTSYSSRLELKKYDSLIVPVEINMKVIGDSFIHAILRDVTEKEKIEKLILETERWKAMAELSGGIAHNFNNILAIISGRTQLIKSLTNDERINKNIRAIENMIEEGKKITGKIIDFVQSNGKKTHSQLINLNNLILEVIELAKLKWKDISRIEEKFISIKTNLGDIPEIEANRVELENVFLNIIYNSVEAIEKEGEIEFTTSFKEPYVSVEIKDNGRGISPEVMGKIFDPFFTTKGTIGTGLGLTICYNTVKRQGGDIKVESKEGEGTKIFIYLPYKSLKTRTKI